MNKKTDKLAFSLIELSIVILVIGILVAGITKGKRIMAQAKLKSAIALTTSSPVTSMSGLSLWLESTNENNFPTGQAVDGANITGWNDSNPQTVSKNNFSRGTSNANIAYKASGINNLPVINFNGTSGTVNSLTGGVITTANNGFTLFIVAQAAQNNSPYDSYLFQDGTGSGFAYKQSGGVSTRDLLFIGVKDNGTTSVMPTAPEIATIMYDSSLSNPINIFANGSSQFNPTGGMKIIAPSSNTMITPAGVTYVGNDNNGSSPWQGYIGEIIFFDHILKTYERNAVESYLGSKWGIKVSS